MIIKTLTLTNFRGIREMTLRFNERLTVLVGVNGAGKSTVLDALAILLSWGAARISDPDQEGRRIPGGDITNGTNHAFLGLELKYAGRSYGWSLLQRMPGREVEAPEAVRGESDFAAPIRRRYTETNAECSLPVMVLYPVGRVVRQVSPRPSRSGTEILDIYNGALTSEADFRLFFEWCREQDDIANEERSGREWFVRHRYRIDRSTSKLLDVFRGCLVETRNDRPSVDEFRDRLRGSASDTPERFFTQLCKYLAELAEGLPRELFEIPHKLQYLGVSLQQISPASPDEQHGEFLVKRALMSLYDHLIRETDSQIQTRVWTLLREMVLLSLDLNLWWMSREGKQRLNRAVSEFLPRPSGDSHQQLLFPLLETQTLDDTLRILASEVSGIIANDIVQREGDVWGRETYTLRLVFRAIETFLPEFKHLRISRKPTPTMLAQKDDETFDINQLSDGEKCLIAMVGDLARRLTMANPTMENPLDGEGVVLVDEIDLHLHPKWQRTVVPRLLATFPNIQFILTTHSPQVLSHVEDKSVFLVSQTSDRGIVHVPLTEAYGQTYERLLEDVFGVDARPDEVRQELELLFDLIQKNNVAEARAMLLALRRRIGADPDLTRADFLLHRKEEAAR